jgi:histidinol-phosphate aminotransferase
VTLAGLARPEIASLIRYEPAAQEHLTIRLNANEVPWSTGTDAHAQHNRYPPVRPWALRKRLAEIYSVDPHRLLVTRGSSEAIDLLVRVFCRPAQDHIVIATPTFGMYKVYAGIQHAGVRSVALRAGQGFSLDVPGLLLAAGSGAKLVFLCSPNNPTGNSVCEADLVTLLQAQEGRSLVVVDEAYIEFSGTASAVELVERFENLVVLRTLSKAYGMAAARVGAVIAHPDVISLLDAVMAPYAIATTIIEQALAALSNENLARIANRIASLQAERARLIRQLADLPSVVTIWPSDGNFLLVRFRDLSAVTKRLALDRILIRDFSAEPGLENCARITVGSHDESSLLLHALQGRSTAHA